MECLGAGHYGKIGRRVFHKGRGMIRRDAIVGLLAAPFGRLFGKRPQSVGNFTCHWHTGLHYEFYKKTSKGLERIKWGDMRPGDENVVMDWVDGRIVKITDAGTSLSCRDKLNNPYPDCGIDCIKGE